MLSLSNKNTDLTSLIHTNTIHSLRSMSLFYIKHKSEVHSNSVDLIHSLEECVMIRLYMCNNRRLMWNKVIFSIDWNRNLVCLLIVMMYCRASVDEIHTEMSTPCRQTSRKKSISPLCEYHCKVNEETSDDCVVYYESNVTQHPWRLI